MANEPTTFAAKNQKDETISKETLASTYTVLKSVEATYSKKGSDNPEVGTNAADSMEDITILFEVHKCFKEMKINASLTVDDWGSLVIEGKEDDGTQVTPVNIDMLKTAELAGERGGHALWTKEVKGVVLKPGKYTIKITHQNVTYAAEYDPKYNDATCNFSIQATAVSHFKQADAQRLLDSYSPVNYNNITNAANVWKYCGGDIYDLHLNNPEDFYNSCAIRMSVALDGYGKSLPFVINKWVSPSTAACKKYDFTKNERTTIPVFSTSLYANIRAREVSKMIKDWGMGASHFTSKAKYEEFAALAGDVLIISRAVGSGDHIALVKGTDWSIGGPLGTEACWLLYRQDAIDPTNSAF